jgi:hypothetical protein
MGFVVEIPAAHGGVGLGEEALHFYGFHVAIAQCHIEGSAVPLADGSQTLGISLHHPLP